MFLPFKGFLPSDAAPALDQTQKLQLILQNVSDQQATVRGNMMSMVEQRVESLRANARRELDELESDYEDDSGDPEERRQLRAEIKVTFQKAKIPASKDAKSEDFEANPGELKPYNGNGIANRVATDGDVDMAGTEDAKPRTAKVVWEGLSKDILDLVDKASEEIVLYDRHAQTAINVYKQALERRNGGRQVPAPIATGNGGGILRNRNEESPIDLNAIRRMSTGMPVVGVVPPSQPSRAYEKMDEIARRGSNGK